MKPSIWKSVVRAGARENRGLRALAARWLRVLLLSAASFTVNEILVRAAALTFTTLLGFIPFAIILSSVAGKLGYLHLLSKLIPYIASSLNLDIPLDPILSSINRAQRIGFHRLGLWGTLGLLFSFFLSMGNAESAVNRVWNLRPRRGSWKRLKMYAPFLLMLLFLVAVGGLLLLRTRHGLERWGFKGSLPLLRFHGKSIVFGAAGLLVFIWLALLLTIRILPNTKVRMRSAIFGTTVATLLIYLLSRLLLLFPTLLLDQNRFLYGSLAVFPVVLLLTYIFWAAALFGVAASFIHQYLNDGRVAASYVGRKLTEDSKPRVFHGRNIWKEILHDTQMIYWRRKA